MWHTCLKLLHQNLCEVTIMVYEQTAQVEILPHHCTWDWNCVRRAFFLVWSSSGIVSGTKLHCVIQLLVYGA